MNEFEPSGVSSHELARYCEQKVLRQRAAAMVWNRAAIKIVDFDNTILATNPIHQQANPLTFETMNIPVCVTPELAESFRGKSDPQIFALLLGEQHCHRINEAISLRISILDKLAAQEPNIAQYFLPGMETFVRILRATSQQAGIASVSHDSFVQTLLQRAMVDGRSIEDVFPLSAVTGSSSTILLKPDPYSVYESARRLQGHCNGEILYVGDSTTDAETIQDKPGCVGVIVDANKCQQLANKFAGAKNLLFIRSITEILI